MHKAPARSPCATSLALVLAPPGMSLAAPPPDEGGGGVKVHRLKPWRSNYLYRAERTFYARRDPARAADRIGTWISKGDYFRITCQAYAATS